MKKTSKKIVSLILTIAMLMSFMTFTASAETVLPAFAEGDYIYAGQQTITIKLAANETATELTTEQAALVKITRMDTGANIAFTSEITGDILTIMPTEEFVINDANSGTQVSYLVELGEIKKVFTVNKLWEDSIDTATSTEAAQTGLNPGRTEAKPDAVADGKIIYDTTVKSRNGSGTGIYPNEATYINKENVSFSVKVQFLNKFPAYAVVFNADSEYGYTYYANNQKFNGFGFHTYFGHSGSKWYKKYTHTNKPVYNYYDSASNTIKTTFTPTYSGSADTAVLNCRPLIELSEAVGTTASKTKWTDSNYVVTDEMKDKNIFKLTVDKMGSVATLVQEGKLSPELTDAEEANFAAYKEKTAGITATKNIVNVYDTAEVYETIASGKVVPTTGRFGICTTGANTVMAFYDMILTETVIEDYDDSLNVTEEIYAGQQTITVKLATEKTATQLRPEQAAKIKITRMDTGADIAFTNKITGDILTIMPTEEFVINDSAAASKVSYLVELDNIKKVFTVNKLWEDKLDSAESVAVEETGLKNSTTKVAESDSATAVADGKLIYDGVADKITNGAAIYPDEDTYINKENVSFSAKVQFLNKFPSYNIMFNMNEETALPYYAKAGYVGFGFHTYYGQSGAQWYDKYTHTNKPVYHYNANDIIVDAFLPAYSGSADTAVLNSKPLIELSADVQTTASNKKWTDTSYVVTNEMKDKNIFKLTVDKMGSVATLVQDGKLFDTSITETKNLVYVYDIADVFETVPELAGKTVPTTGRFGIATYGGNTVMAFYDMILTETVIEDVAEHDITNVDAAYASGKITGTVNFANYSENPITSCKIIVGAYKGNNMVGLTAYTVTDITNEAIKNVPYEITGLNEKPDEVRAFVWKDFITIKPYCSVKIEGLN